MESNVYIVTDWKGMNMLFNFPEFNISIMGYNVCGRDHYSAKIRYREMSEPLSGTFSVAELKDTIEKNELANRKKRERYDRQLDYIAFLLEYDVIRDKITDAKIGSEEAYEYCHRLARAFKKKNGLTTDDGNPGREWVLNYIAEEEVNIDRYFRGINPLYGTYGDCGSISTK